MFKNGICPICGNNTNFFSKTLVKISNDYICQKCMRILNKANINIFNITKCSVNDLIAKKDEVTTGRGFNSLKKEQKLLQNEKNNNIEDPDLALDVFNTLSVGFSMGHKEQKKVDKILNLCHSRQDILNRVIEICGVPNTPKQRYIYAMAYGWSNKEYRKKAIYYIKFYLNNELYEDIYLHHFRNINSTIEERKQEHIYDMQSMLIDLYIKEYDFNNALLLTEKNISLIPTLPLAYRKKAEILVKTNQIDEAIIFLKEFKKSKYYCKYKDYSPSTWMIDTIDELLNDCISKKQNNYIYKPRKQTINYID